MTKKNEENTENSEPEVVGQKTAGSKFFTQKPRDAIHTIDAEDKIELERREAYIEPETRDLLRKLLQSERQELIPVYDLGVGFVYHLANPASNENGDSLLQRECLENLARLDIMQKSFYDTASACPNCSSTIITLHSRCPKCKSHNVVKTSLTEHIPCGNIEQRTNYVNNRCPKCGDLLVEGQYRNMGRWYLCNDCGERFEHPELDIVCRKCNRNFAVKEAKVAEIPKFKLKASRVREIRQNVASLEDIRTLLEELGFVVQIPGLIVGEKSGMQHHFSLIANKKINEHEILIALDHSVSEGEVQTSPLILYIYKTSEVKVDIPIFVAIPQLNDTARKIAQGHDILLIEGSTDQQEIMERIKQEIENRIGKKADTTQSQEQQPQQTKGSIFGKLRGKKN